MILNDRTLGDHHDRQIMRRQGKSEWVFTLVLLAWLLIGWFPNISSWHQFENPSSAFS